MWSQIKSQSGRSMTEIIAVLALIGVLSLGALSGYEWAINRHRANVLGREILQRGADIKMQLDRSNATANVSKWESVDSQSGYPIDFVQDKDENRVGIRVQNVTGSMCRSVYDDLKSLSSIDEIEGGECDDENDNNTMIFYYSGFKKTGKVSVTCSCDYPKVCDENKNCVCPAGTPTGADANTCDCPTEQVNDGGECVCLGGKIFIGNRCVGCATNDDCGTGEICADNECVQGCVSKECPTSDFAETLCACCPDDSPKWVDSEGVCKSCADIDNTMPVYNTTTKVCEACPDTAPIWNGTSCVGCPDDAQVWDNFNKQCVECLVDTDCGNGFVCSGNMCECATGTTTPCSSNVLETIKTSVYNQMCYICSCPDSATISGNTCVCNNECQTYNTSTKTCVNKTDGVTCSGGLCKNGTCTNDTCTTGVKSCSSGYTANKVGTTTYGNACYQCCASPKTWWNGSSCACPSNAPKYANTSTCACNSGETNQSGVCTPTLYSTCATYCKNRNSTTSETFKTCRNMTTTSKLNLKLYLQHTVSVNGTKTYTLVSENTLKTNGTSETYTYKLGTGSTYFETFCEYGYATYNGSYYSLEWTKASSNSLCNGLISGSSAKCYTSYSKEISNAQKTTCDSFCDTYASRYGW